MQKEYHFSKKDYFFTLKQDDITLIVTLLKQHRDMAFAKARFYAYCNGDGSYNSTLARYKRLISRFERLLSIIHV